MPFQVPQFIEHEPRVVGPFTFKQFVYLAVPGAVAFFLYFTAPFSVFVFGTVLLEAVGFGLGFVKIGGKSLPEFLLNAVGFAFGPKTYIWKGRKRGAAADTMASYSQTSKEQTIAGQLKLKQGGLVQNLSKDLETKR